MHRRKRRLTYALATLAIWVVLVLFSPIGAQAADPIDDPVRQPHLKSWSNVIPNAAKRFVVLSDFNNAAVLDRETGLVWEQAPTEDGYWKNARTTCINKIVGNRKGWRLPSIVELTSLIDPSIGAPGPTLPSGHPFTLRSAGYWSATTDANDSTAAWFVQFSDGTVYDGFHKTSNSIPIWCVRGSMNASAY